MRKRNILLVVALLGSVIASQSSVMMTFTNSSSEAAANVITDVLTIDAGALSVSSSGNMDLAIEAFGSSSVDDTFVLSVFGGFDFDATSAATWTWDTTAYTNALDNNFNYRDTGLSLTGSGGGNQFDLGEIIWFEVSGLEAGNSLKIPSYTVLGNVATAIDFYSEIGGAGIEWIDSTVIGQNFLTDMVLENGDRFGFGMTADKNRGELGAIEFDVIPEPATMGMFTAMGGALLWFRRRFKS
jgi:hypothetical protein